MPIGPPDSSRAVRIGVLGELGRRPRSSADATYPRGRRAPHSLGTASSPEDGAELEGLYRVADADLYANKFAGRGAAAALSR